MSTITEEPKLVSQVLKATGTTEWNSQQSINSSMEGVPLAMPSNPETQSFIENLMIFNEEVQCDDDEIDFGATAVVNSDDVDANVGGDEDLQVFQPNQVQIPNLESIPDDPIKNFKDLRRRSINHVENRSDLADTLQFYADTRFTPLPVAPGVFQVLTSGPGFKGNTFEWSYTIFHHGLLTHSWSLLPAGKVVKNSGPILRPIGILNTYGVDIKKHESRITDLTDLDSAVNIKLSHYWDSYSQYGKHVGFNIDDDYRYEWKPKQGTRGRKTDELFLWRTNNIDDTSSVAARIFPESFVKNPVSGDDLWCLEVDNDRVPPHLALLSAFYIKETRSTGHAFFAPRKIELPRAMPLLNFAFQDEGTIYQNTELFWGGHVPQENDLEKDRREQITKIILIRVFNRAFLEQYALNKEIINLLQDEAESEIAILKAKYNIFI